MQRTILRVLCLGAALHGLQTPRATAALIGMELLVNGGAETGDTTGWTSTGIEAVVAAGFHAGFGSYTFTGGLGDPSQTLLQSVDVSSLAAAIDGGLIASNFGIQLQARATGGSGDSAEATLRFRNAGNAIIESAFFSDPDVNVNDDFDWDFFSDLRVVPTGTRSIEVFLNTTRTAGISSDGFFDEASLTLTNVPEPTSLALLGLTAAGFCGVRLRRRRKDERAGTTQAV